MYQTFVCENCGKESRKHKEIEICEAFHLGLNNIEDYQRWKLLDDYAKECTRRLSYQSNQNLRDTEEDAYKKLLAFEKEHKMNI